MANENIQLGFESKYDVVIQVAEVCDLGKLAVDLTRFDELSGEAQQPFTD